jgi:hypothetical protein
MSADLFEYRGRESSINTGSGQNLALVCAGEPARLDPGVGEMPFPVAPEQQDTTNGGHGTTLIRGDQP